jgi:aarF domain-containing kinase
MAGKRLLDIAALFNASRGVVQKHIALRGRQLDVYNRTSTLARAVRNQTERVTETAKAASILASRLNESAPAWTSETTDERPTAQSEDGETIPRKDAEGKAPQAQQEEGLEQDHFYERSESNSAVDQKPTEDLNILQEKADRYPLPDGTIPQAESEINKPAVDHDVISTSPRDELLKEPLESDGLESVSSGASSIPTPRSRPLSAEAARRTQRQFEEQIPSKTADALGETSADPLEEGHDEDSFYRTSGHTSPTLSSLPRVKIPKHPSSVQKGDPEGLNSDIFYDAEGSQKSEQIPSVEAVSEQEQVPEGINTDLFYSPRIARMLGGKMHAARERDLKLKGVESIPVDRTDPAEGKDQDTFNVCGSSQALPTSPEVSSNPSLAAKPTDRNEDIEKLAQDLARDSNQSTKVRFSLKPWKWHSMLNTDSDLDWSGVSNAINSLRAPRVQSPSFTTKQIIQLWRSSSWHVRWSDQ